MISISGDAKTDLCLVILGWKGRLETKYHRWNLHSYPTCAWYRFSKRFVLMSDGTDVYWVDIFKPHYDIGTVCYFCTLWDLKVIISHSLLQPFFKISSTQKPPLTSKVINSNTKGHQIPCSRLDQLCGILCYNQQFSPKLIYAIKSHKIYVHPPPYRESVAL